MKLTIPGILITRPDRGFASLLSRRTPVIRAPPGRPGASVAKDDTSPTKMTKHSKKHTASYK